MPIPLREFKAYKGRQGKVVLIGGGRSSEPSAQSVKDEVGYGTANNGDPLNGTCGPYAILILFMIVYMRENCLPSLSSVPASVIPSIQEIIELSSRPLSAFSGSESGGMTAPEVMDTFNVLMDINGIGLRMVDPGNVTADQLNDYIKHDTLMLWMQPDSSFGNPFVKDSHFMAAVPSSSFFVDLYNVDGKENGRHQLSGPRDAKDNRRLGYDNFSKVFGEVYIINSK